MVQTENKKELPNRIDDMFHGRAILITGGSGFLGKVLIEKLLRTCPGIKSIYLLLREKKGKTPNERIQEIFSNVLFDVLKVQNPAALKKCIPIAGDVTEMNLGISPEDRQRLRNETEFIFHAAASTRFDDTVKVAARMNTRGTKFMLDLANECKKLKVFVHVSTAYAHPKERVLYERIYRPPANPHDILDIMDFERSGNSENDEVVHLNLLGDCPNTYTFTKALAEELVAEQIDKLPVIIVRPSVVCPTLYEPIPGWCNNLQGPMGLFVGAGKGVIRSMYIKGDTYADFVPADLCINAMILATWSFFTQNKNQRVYNLTSSADYSYSWQQIIEIGKDVLLNHVPFNGILWFPGGSFKQSRILHNFCFYSFQLVPAIFIDLLLIILGYKPVLYQIQRRIQKGSEMFEYYTMKAWNFSNEKTLDISRKFVNPLENKLFRLSVEGEFVVKDYFVDCMMSVRRNNLKETDDMLPAARRNMKIMRVLDVICKGLFVMACFYYVFKWVIVPLLQKY